MSSPTLSKQHDAHAAHGHHDAGANKVFGFWIYLMSDCIIFATLFATYAVMVHNTAGGLQVRISSNCLMFWVKQHYCCSAQ